MRRVAGLLFAAILLLSLPTLAPAAGLLGMGSYGFPSLFGGTNGSSCCDPGGAFCCPAVYFGYNVEQNRTRRPVSFGSTNTQPTRGAGENQLTVSAADPSGFWLGVSEYCRLGDKFGILLAGWYLFPSKNDADEVYDITLDSRLWSSSKSEGWIDAAVVLGSQCGLNLIGGFRWDAYSIQLRNPTNLNAVAARGTPLDEANLTVNWFIPYLGTQYCCGGPCCGLLVRVIGFPWVPGAATYSETGFAGVGTRFDGSWTWNRSHFLEVFAEASKECGFGCLGLFGRFNYIDGKGSTIPSINGVPLATSYDFTMNRSSWTLGGRIAVNFNMSGIGFGLF
jgi:hypothetical protein